MGLPVASAFKSTKSPENDKGITKLPDIPGNIPVVKGQHIHSCVGIAVRIRITR